jgi:SAM-dependent methyltransferase
LKTRATSHTAAAPEREATWKQSLRRFFAERALAVDAVPTLEDLCFISGRDARLWADPAIYDDMIKDIVAQCHLARSSTVLEVGCAAGFIARGLAPVVGSYVGIDLAPPALAVARRLGLRNADFHLGDGTRLPFDDGAFDAAYCYDVFTNFPSFTEGTPIIGEMLRAVRPDGRVMIGSIPDAAMRIEYEKRVGAVARGLEARYGPPRTRPPRPPHWSDRLRSFWSSPAATRILPEIVCYNFEKSDFMRLGDELGVATEVRDIHPANPYRGCRFNAIYVKRSG